MIKVALTIALIILGGIFCLGILATFLAIKVFKDIFN